jgi:hypothetical protein
VYAKQPDWTRDNNNKNINNDDIDAKKETTPYDEWDVDMILVFRYGPRSGTYAVIVRRPSQDGTVALRMRESSSSGRSSDDNEIITGECRDLRFGEPRRKDMVMVLSGKNRGHMGKVKVMGSKDVILDNLPWNTFRISQVAWMHTRPGASTNNGSIVAEGEKEIAASGSSSSSGVDVKCLLCGGGGEALVRIMRMQINCTNYVYLAV